MKQHPFTSYLEHIFHISERQTSLRREITGGITTFLAMAYIIFVNPSILALSGMDKGALITVTCIASAFGTLLMGLFSNVPIALAPGMGINAFFTYTLVLGQGVSWEQALGVVFISSIIFFFLTISPLRKHIAKGMPPVIIVSSSAGIGLFIALIGLQNMNLVVAHPTTLLAMGQLTVPVILALCTFVLMIILEIKNVRGSLLLGILISTIIGISLGQVEIPAKLISMPPSIAPIAFKMDIVGALKWSFFPAIFSFMFLGFFDCLATVLACSKNIGIQDKTGEIPTLPRMLYHDAIANVFGAAMGTSTVTAFIESSAGITAGARTGLASLITGLLFLLALFFTPLVGMVPSFAVAPALVTVGILMFSSLSLLDFSDKKVAIVAFVTIVMMPFTYSISNGLTFGFLTYIVLHLVVGEFKKIHPILWAVGILCLLNLVLM